MPLFLRLYFVLYNEEDFNTRETGGFIMKLLKGIVRLLMFIIGVLVGSFGLIGMHLGIAVFGSLAEVFGSATLMGDRLTGYNAFEETSDWMFDDVWPKIIEALDWETAKNKETEETT